MTDTNFAHPTPGALRRRIEDCIDICLALARHYSARFRRRFVNGDTPVMSLVKEVDFGRWYRTVKHSPRPIEDLDAFLDLDQFPGEGYHA